MRGRGVREVCANEDQLWLESPGPGCGLMMINDGGGVCVVHQADSQGEV